LRPVLECLVEFLEVARLATKRRSGVAAEDQDDRFLVFEAGERDLAIALEERQSEIGGRVADLERVLDAVALGRRRVDLAVAFLLASRGLAAERHHPAQHKQQCGGEKSRHTASLWKRPLLVSLLEVIRFVQRLGARSLVVSGP